MLHIIDHKHRFLSAADAYFATAALKPGEPCRS